jgi:hypothetical protein
MRPLACLFLLLALSSCGLKEMRREHLRKKAIKATLAESLDTAKLSGVQALEFQFQARNGDDAAKAVALFEAAGYEVDYMSLPDTHKCLVLVYHELSIDDQEALLAYVLRCLGVAGDAVKRFYGLRADPDA